MSKSLETCLQESIAYCPTDTRNAIIRRAAFYCKIANGIKEVKYYYDDPNYPGWHGGFISTGLKDFRGRTYGLVKKLVWTDNQTADCLRKLRKLYKAMYLEKENDYKRTSNELQAI